MNIESFERKKIAIIGLGYVGLPLAVHFGRHRPTVGFDINGDRISELKNGIDSTAECSVHELSTSSFLTYTCDDEDLRDVGVYIVTVPTPIDSARRPDLTSLLKASELIGKYLSVGDCVVYESTVFPGATEEICVPVLEKLSSLRLNKDFFCGYSPERINPGDKVNTLSTITKIVSGSTLEVGRELEKMYSQIISAGTKRVSSIRVAEASKVIENSQRDLNIAFVNELSLIFERLGIDTLEVLEAAETKWNFLPFRPGMVGGHCIGVDPYYLTHKAEEVGYTPQIILAGRRLNDNMSIYAATCVIKRMSSRGIDISSASIAVLGLTFKENCPDVRNSKIFDVINEFADWGMRVVVVDPVADLSKPIEGLDCRVTFADLKDLKDLDSVVIAVGHSQFRALEPCDLVTICPESERAVVGDLKGLYEKDSLEKLGFEVFRL